MIDFGPDAQLGLAPVDLEQVAGYFRDGEFKELIDAAPALIVELHASRSRLRDAERLRDWQSNEYFPILRSIIDEQAARIARLERVREAARDIPLCNDCMEKSDDLLAALAAVGE